MGKILVGDRLAWFKNRSDKQEFWESHWERKTDAFKELSKARKGCRGIYKKIFRKWIPEGMPVLEGGCGIGSMAMALQSEGYDVTGVDFSAGTVLHSKELAPDLNIEQGDILDLNFPEDHFGAYVSLGVVEHSWEGPLEAIKEAYRVIRTGGVFICSVPYFSPIRKLKAFAGSYSSSEAPDSDSFYQFAFTKREFDGLLHSAGFRTAAVYYHAAVLGMRKELPGFDKFYRMLPGLIGKALNKIELGRSIFGHMMIFVAVKL